MSASRCSRPPPRASSLPRRTARTLASGPWGSVGEKSITGASWLGRLVLGQALRVEAVVDVAPSPVLIGLRGSDHGVACLAEVRRGMAVAALVAAARASAVQTRPEVHPRVATLDAPGAHRERFIDADVGLVVDTEPRHVT